MIELENVTKIYEGTVTAIDKISFEVQEGEIFGLIGTSGCGKTTTLKMINRLEEPTTGQIFIDGESILNRPPEQLRRSIGYVIQNVGLFPHYTVQQNIAITPKLLNWDAGRIDQRSAELLQMVGLEDKHYAGRQPADLSGGQQQRVGLARALAADPPLILMDEPFGALDPITKERIQKEFKKLLQGIQKTIVLVTHDVFEAFDLCDRIGLMNEGKMQQVGTSRELLFRPDNKFVHSFFDSQRFQLEMMTVTIGDIVATLKESGTIKSSHSPSPSYSGKGEAQQSFGEVGQENDNMITAEDSFHSIFERSGTDIEKCYVANSDDEVITKLSPDQLLEGFHQVRRNLYERHDD